ncbi:polysaccharide biosynthesis C-terminal domain-containing protein [Pseudarthrobacter oxydans]|uniref:oligosaccharide flippase family protein n=1 Tax=Pseudarthrobacter oxydans TaxID=1671 RepID=UPI003819D41B
MSPLTLSWICDIGVLVAKRDFLGIVSLQLLQPTSYLVGIIVLWVTELATTASVIWVFVGSNVVSFFFGLFRAGIAPKGAATRPKMLAKGSIRYSGGALAESASNRLDQVIALPILGAAQAGLYSVSVTVGLAPLAIAQALSSSSFTPITTARDRRRKRLISESISHVASLSIVAALLLFCFGPSLVDLLFGEAFRDAAPAIRMSAVSCFMASIAVQASSNLIAIGRPRQLAFTQMVSLAVGIAGLLVLGPALGSLGAAIASAIGYGVLAILAVHHCHAGIRSMLPTPRAFVGGLKVLLRSR